MGIYFYDIARPAADERRRERAVLRSGALDAGRDPVLHAIVAEARHAVATRMAAISIVFGDWQYLVVAIGIAPGPVRRAYSFCAHAIHDPGVPLVVADAARDPRFAGNPIVHGFPAIRFYAGQPLVDDERQSLGTLCVFDPAPRTGLSAGEAERLAELSQRTAAHLAAA